MTSLFLGVAQRAILAVFHGTGTLQRNVFERVPQRAATSIANGHVSVHFDNGDLVHQFQRVAAVFAQFVLIVLIE